MRNKTILTFCISILFISNAFSGAWTKDHRAGFFKFDYSVISAKNIFLDDGSLAPFKTTLSNHSFSLYGEYGFHKRITGIAYIPFLVHNVLNRGILPNGDTIAQTGASTTNFGDIDLGAKFLIYNKNGFVLSTSLILGIPTGKFDTLQLNSTDGEFNQLLKLEAGYAKKKWWISGGVGFNHRTKGFSEEFRFDAEFGIKLIKDQLILGAKISGNISLRNETPNQEAIDAGSQGLFANNVSFISPQLYIAYEYKKKVGIVAQAATALYATNVLAAPAFSFGIYYNLPGKAPKNKQAK